MKNYIKYLLATLGVTTLITAVYYFIDFEIQNMFYNKLQITMIPGILFVYKAIRMTIGSSAIRLRGTYVSSRINKQSQKDQIDASKSSDLSEISIMLAYLTSGIIQIVFGILIGKMGTL
jgi:hypothetical protein